MLKRKREAAAPPLSAFAARQLAASVSIDNNRLSDDCGVKLNISEDLQDDSAQDDSQDEILQAGSPGVSDSGSEHPETVTDATAISTIEDSRLTADQSHTAQSGIQSSFVVKLWPEQDGGVLLGLEAAEVSNSIS